jgi:hypothetical protein
MLAEVIPTSASETGHTSVRHEGRWYEETCARVALSMSRSCDSIPASMQEVGSWRGVGSGRSS